ncbi:TDP-N-acetylfucosamine:lipid II N-acetylfucosaminyltransferase [Methylomicrobium lacus]|uniref:TDP-N-acetylfucosamine:lipid II N-acetylfucosaminyltransferase n=1 Tax=Methylomicrobium lacus TaxID=136992 RepID=UPI0035A877AC
MKILHLVNDEKFISFIANAFDACDGITNLFLVIVPDGSIGLRYIANLKDMRVVDESYIKSGAVIKDLKWCDGLVVHYLDGIKARAVLRAKEHSPVVWSGWGADYYDWLPISGSNFLGEETSSLQALLDQESTLSMYGLTKRLKEVVKKQVHPLILYPWLRKSLRRIDYFSAPVPEDFHLLKSHLKGKFPAEYVQLNYGSVEHTFALGSNSQNANNILIGNSASATNNHLEIFQLLSRIDLEGREVIVPLSYGNAAYRDAVIMHGQNILGQHFHPIVDFMPLDRYNELIANCSVVIMGHRRQQAVGNTATMLYKGAKVYLDEASTVYQFFKARGACIYSLRDLEIGDKTMFSQLADDQKQKNREILESFWGHEVVLDNVRKLIEMLKDHGVSKKYA